MNNKDMPTSEIIERLMNLSDMVPEGNVIDLERAADRLKELQDYVDTYRYPYGGSDDEIEDDPEISRHAEAVREFVEDYWREDWSNVDEDLLRRVPLEEIENANNTYKHGTDYTVVCSMAESQYEAWSEEYGDESEE